MGSEMCIRDRSSSNPNFVSFTTFPLRARAAGRALTAIPNFSSVPPCELGHVRREVLLCELFLRQTHGRSAPTVFCRVDVKEVFRKVLVDPVGASVFGHVTGGRVVVDLPLQFGWRNSHGYWGLLASVREQTHTRSTFQGAVVSPQGAAAVAHAGMPRRRGFLWCRSRVIVALSLVWAAMPGATSLCGTTSMMVFSSSCNGGLTVAVA